MHRLDLMPWTWLADRLPACELPRTSYGVSCRTKQRLKNQLGRNLRLKNTFNRCRAYYGFDFNIWDVIQSWTTAQIKPFVKTHSSIIIYLSSNKKNLCIQTPVRTWGKYVFLVIITYSVQQLMQENILLRSDKNVSRAAVKSVDSTVTSLQGPSVWSFSNVFPISALFHLD